MTLIFANKNAGLISAFLIILGAFFMLPFGALNEWGNVPFFLVGAGFLCLGFLYHFQIQRTSSLFFWTVALLPRVLLLWQAPGDDLYRYVWEGRVLWAGFNPYLHAPDAQSLYSLRDLLWQSVEYKPITAIYPPLTELLFGIFSQISSTAFFFKFTFMLADIALIYLLSCEFGRNRTRLYAWNPLIIYSFSGGGHYDSFFILALLFGWLSHRKEKILLAAFGIGMAIALKWIALPLGGWILWGSFHSSKRAQTPLILFSLISPMLVSWLLLSAWTNEWTLQIFPQHFVQNARSVSLIPEIMGSIWPASLTKNHWFLIPLGLSWLLIITRIRSFASAAEWIFFLLWIFSPMMHGWYFTWIVPFAVLTRNQGTIAISVSAFIYFSIHHFFKSPGGQWELPIPLLGLLWTPFLFGFLYFKIKNKHDDENTCRSVN